MRKSVGLKWLRAQDYRSVIGPERCAEEVSAYLAAACGAVTPR